MWPASRPPPSAAACYQHTHLYSRLAPTSIAELLFTKYARRQHNYTIQCNKKLTLRKISWKRARFTISLLLKTSELNLTSHPTQYRSFRGQLFQTECTHKHTKIEQKKQPYKNNTIWNIWNIKLKSYRQILTNFLDSMRATQEENHILDPEACAFRIIQDDLLQEDRVQAETPLSSSGGCTILCRSLRAPSWLMNAKIQLTNINLHL